MNQQNQKKRHRDKKTGRFASAPGHANSIKADAERIRNILIAPLSFSSATFQEILSGSLKKRQPKKTEGTIVDRVEKARTLMSQAVRELRTAAVELDAQADVLARKFGKTPPWGGPTTR